MRISSIIKPRAIVAPGALALALAASGCGTGDDAPTLSTRADEDPARYQQAQQEAERAREVARKAEAKALKGAIDVEQP